MHLHLLVALLSRTALADGPAPEVALPTTWTARISANIYQPGRGKSYTLTRDEWYFNSKVRVDEPRPFGTLTQVVDYEFRKSDTPRVYSIFFTDATPEGFCQAKDEMPADDDTVQNRFYLTDEGTLRSTADFLAYNATKVNYIGTTSPDASFRGVAEDWYEEPFGSYTLYYGFSISNWSFPNENVRSPRLQSVILNGSSIRANESEPQLVHHAYEFYDLRELSVYDQGALDPCELAGEAQACACEGPNPVAFGCPFGVEFFSSNDVICTGAEYYTFSNCDQNGIQATISTTANPYNPRTPKSEKANKSIIAVRYSGDSGQGLYARVVTSLKTFNKASAVSDAEIEVEVDSFPLFRSVNGSKTIESTIDEVPPKAGAHRYVLIESGNGIGKELCMMKPQAPRLPNAWKAVVEENVVEDTFTDRYNESEYRTEYYSSVQDAIRIDKSNASAVSVRIEDRSAGILYQLEANDDNPSGSCKAESIDEDNVFGGSVRNVAAPEELFGFDSNEIVYSTRVGPKGVPLEGPFTSLRGIDVEYWKRDFEQKNGFNGTLLYGFATNAWEQRFEPSRRPLVSLVVLSQRNNASGTERVFVDSQYAGFAPLRASDAELAFNPCSITLLNSTASDAEACGCDDEPLQRGIESAETSSSGSGDKQYSQGGAAGIAIFGIVLGIGLTVASFFVGRAIRKRQYRHQDVTNEI